MQVAGMEGEASRSVVADSTWLALRRVVKDGGGRGLFAGIVPTYLKVMPATAIGAPPHHHRHDEALYRRPTVVAMVWPLA